MTQLSYKFIVSIREALGPYNQEFVDLEKDLENILKPTHFTGKYI